MGTLKGIEDGTVTAAQTFMGQMQPLINNTMAFVTGEDTRLFNELGSLQRARNTADQEMIDIEGYIDNDILPQTPGEESRLYDQLQILNGQMDVLNGEQTSILGVFGGSMGQLSYERGQLQIQVNSLTDQYNIQQSFMNDIDLVLDDAMPWIEGFEGQESEKSRLNDLQGSLGIDRGNLQTSQGTMQGYIDNAGAWYIDYLGSEGDLWEFDRPNMQNWGPDPAIFSLEGIRRLGR